MVARAQPSSAVSAMTSARGSARWGPVTLACRTWEPLRWLVGTAPTTVRAGAAAVLSRVLSEAALGYEVVVGRVAVGGWEQGSGSGFGRWWCG